MNLNEYEGKFFGKYNIETKQYSGIDYSKKCFIFSGQGNQFPGMFKNEVKCFEVLGTYFKALDEFSRNIGIGSASEFILKEKQTSTLKQLLCLFTLQVGLFEVLKENKNINLNYITSHSFGECAALVCSGIMDFVDMLDYIYHREQILHKNKNKGYMIAVGTDKNNLKSLLRNFNYYLSIENSKEQSIVAVQEYKKIIKHIKSQGYKCKKLEISHPFHTPMLNETSELIGKHLDKRNYKFNKPKYDIVLSYKNKLLNKNNFNSADVYYVLKKQSIYQIDFISQVKKVYSQGCYGFIEISPITTCNNYIENILESNEFKTWHVKQLVKVNSDKKITTNNSKLLTILNKIISAVTGFSIDSISIHDKYQEDLGIDSIKKADILFKLIEETKTEVNEDFNTSMFKSLKDTVDYFEGDFAKHHKKREKIVSKFLSYRYEWVKKDILKFKKQSNFKILDIDDIQPVKSNKIVIVNKNKKKQNISGLNESMLKKVYKIILQMKELVKINNKQFEIYLISSSDDIETMALNSLLKSTLKEENNLSFVKRILIHHEYNKEELLEIIESETFDSAHNDIMFKDGIRYVQELVQTKQEAIILKEKVNIVAIGGAKGITFFILKNLIEKYDCNLFILGRSEERDVSENLEILRKKGDVKYYSVDASNYDDLEEIFLKIKNVDIILNGAGVLKIRSLLETEITDIEFEYKNKLIPALNTYKMALDMDVKNIINITSFSSKFGSSCHGLYTSANELINIISDKYIEETKKNSVCLNYTAWENIGMSEETKFVQNITGHGCNLLPQKEGFDLFHNHFLSSGNFYFADLTNYLLFQSQLKNFPKYETLIGNFKNFYSFIWDQNMHFAHNNFLKNHRFIKDHKIGSKIIFPASVGITIMFFISYFHKKQYSSLENVENLNPLVLNNDTNIAIDANIKRNSIIIKSKIPVIKANITINNKERERIAFDYFYEINKKLVYKNLMTVKKKFQPINRIFVKKDKISPVIEIVRKELIRLFGFQDIDSMVNWTEASIQGLAIASYLKNSIMGIPYKVDAINPFFENELTEKLYVIPELSRINEEENSILGDVRIVNDRGDVILEYLGMELKKVTKSRIIDFEFKKIR